MEYHYFRISLILIIESPQQCMDSNRYSMNLLERSLMHTSKGFSSKFDNYIGFRYRLKWITKATK